MSALILLWPHIWSTNEELNVAAVLETLHAPERTAVKWKKTKNGTLCACTVWTCEIDEHMLVVCFEIFCLENFQIYFFFYIRYLPRYNLYRCTFLVLITHGYLKWRDLLSIQYYLLLSFFLILLGTLFLLVLLMTKSGAGSIFLNTLCLNCMS